METLFAELLNIICSYVTEKEKDYDHEQMSVPWPYPYDDLLTLQWSCYYQRRVLEQPWNTIKRHFRVRQCLSQVSTYLRDTIPWQPIAIEAARLRPYLFFTAFNGPGKEPWTQEFYKLALMRALFQGREDLILFKPYYDERQKQMTDKKVKRQRL